MNSEAALPYLASARGTEERSGRSQDGSACLTQFRPEYVEDDSTDEALLHMVGKGGPHALSKLFRRHGQTVFNIAYRILRDESEADDLRQDVFLYLYEKAAAYDPLKSSALSWIVQITYHRAFDRRRFLTHRRHYDTQEFRDDVHHRTDHVAAVDRIDSRALLKKFHQELTLEQQQTLELHFFEGYTFHEIAEKTGQTLGNVRHHHYRGLERLRSLIFPRKRD